MRYFTILCLFLISGFSLATEPGIAEDQMVITNVVGVKMKKEDAYIKDARTRFLRSYSQLRVSFEREMDTISQWITHVDNKLSNNESIDFDQRPSYKESFKNESCSGTVESSSLFDDAFFEMVIESGGFECASFNQGIKVHLSAEKETEIETGFSEPVVHKQAVHISCLFPKSQFNSCEEIKVSDINSVTSDLPIQFNYYTNPDFWNKTFWEFARGKGIYLNWAMEKAKRKE